MFISLSISLNILIASFCGLAGARQLCLPFVCVHVRMHPQLCLCVFDGRPDDFSHAANDGEFGVKCCGGGKKGPVTRKHAHP